MKIYTCLVTLLVLGACEIEKSTVNLIKPSITLESVNACLGKVHNRGIPKFEVVKDIIEEVRNTPDEVFAANKNADVYSSVVGVLGPYRDIKHRKAVMANVMIVQAGFESSWKYGEGRDKSANNTSACTEEAGLYQTSGNINTFNAEAKSVLQPFMLEHCNNSSCTEFKRCTKEPVKSFVHGHFMRASRITTRHWGPIRDKHINKWLKRACVSQIEALL